MEKKNEQLNSMKCFIYQDVLQNVAAEIIALVVFQPNFLGIVDDLICNPAQRKPKKQKHHYLIAAQQPRSWVNQDLQDVYWIRLKKKHNEADMTGLTFASTKG